MPGWIRPISTRAFSSAMRSASITPASRRRRRARWPRRGRGVAALESRRLAGEPVSRIIGTREFWGLPLAVTPAVLVPRPETETVVELALSLVADRTRRLRIADLGTGWGAILLALLHELPNASGAGTEFRPARSTSRAAMPPGSALPIARSPRRRFRDGLAGPFDLVVSNPPYIATGEIAALSREVRDHDPRLALDGGADGLAAYRAIAADARRLIGGGHLVVEIGAGQRRDVEFLFTEKGLAIAAVRHDLSGIARAVAARRA